MSDKDFRDFFSKKLKYYLEINKMTQSELAKKLNVSAQTVTNWIKGTKAPRMDKLDTMCSIFDCRRSDLLADDNNDTPQTPSYYLDDKAREAADFLHKHPEYQVLFDATRKVKQGDIDFVKEMIDRMNRGE